MNRSVIVKCESLTSKALTIDIEARKYYIGENGIPFSSCIIKNGYIYYLKPLSQILKEMGFKGVEDVTSNTVICAGYDTSNRNIKDVELISIKDKIRIKITLNSNFPFFDNYESLK